MERLLLKLKMHKIQISPVYTCALLVGVLKKQGLDDARIQQGYVTFGDSACRHFWVTANGQNYDIVTELGKKSNPMISALPIQLETTVDPSVKVQEFEEFKLQLELYETNPKEFWKQKPRVLYTFKC